MNIVSTHPSLPVLTGSGVFPQAWKNWADDCIPQYVKDEFSPKESWKGKPFTEVDARFFFKGVEELSMRFTEDRSRDMPGYFSHAKFRSSYLLYFLPLQAAKALVLLARHHQAWRRIRESVREAVPAAGRKLVFWDLGSGPGTFSQAALMHLSEIWTKEKPWADSIELHWWDTQSKTMTDGQVLTEKLLGLLPIPEGHAQFAGGSLPVWNWKEKVRVIRHPDPWWKAIQDPSKPDLILCGHVLNEGSHESVRRSLPEIFSRAGAGGIFLVEPADRRSSQMVSQVRALILEAAAMNHEGAVPEIFGPCLHAGACPLIDGRDWCHFSVPSKIPGKWFAYLSKGLGSEREWLKFSYVWIGGISTAKAPKAPSVPGDADLRRAISDPMQNTASGGMLLLLCEPEKPARVPTFVKRTSAPGGAPSVMRGDLVSLSGRVGPPKKAGAKSSGKKPGFAGKKKKRSG
ncbi:MAG: hypothetical protein JNL01_15235 [Bdellovibrionales bacterium]|nr:hypothetical protein [Bdellovibrionales bacterium]